MSAPNEKLTADADAPARLEVPNSGNGSTEDDIPERQRSKSVDIPRQKMINQLKSEGGFRTHFVVNHADDVPSDEARPNVKRRPRPMSRGTSYKSFVYSVKSNRKSLARTLSSYSTSYSHFAGENWVEDDEVPGLAGLTAEELALSEAEKAEMRRPERTASFGKAMFMFLKAFIGSGLMFLPKAFENGGLAFSICLMVFIAAICLFAFLRLVETQLQVGGSYGDMGARLWPTRGGSILRITVLFFICISQMGFVASYTIFISQNLYDVVNALSNCASPIQERYYIWMPLVIIIPFAMIRRIAKLSFAAIVADVLILYGIICVIYFTSDQLYHNGVGPGITLINPTNFALMIGTATFSFEGIGLVIPIAEAMKEPEKFPRVVIIGMAIVTGIYILIATLGYLAYGELVQAAVIANLPQPSNLTASVQILYSLAIILSAPFMLFPAIKIVENGIFGARRGRHSQKIKWSKNALRLIMAVICAAVAFGIGADNLDKFVSLVGCVACVPLCFIFPGLFHYKIAHNVRDKIFDIILMIWGVGIMIYTLYVNINSWVHPGPAGATLAPYCPS
ncbi:hypothetical protein K450DRAFT_253500 [Umbelopsis ramanniana AG]|uniref:Amino acid transporter transmembrane domain-containing protein n=1 Tax=Umbelopsis ramanniana AG TaxID=1314678 RepID=A0AAD5HC06_UMBRA|nr:uncharacterized protein K450DRAFT_253500 [Umbelopsis ramanniana AG]KAI8577066.1 hypothetical protein K450DRAFT_253500 [Umbelopsis ramanniana AG]